MEQLTYLIFLKMADGTPDHPTTVTSASPTATTGSTSRPAAARSSKRTTSASCAGWARSRACWAKAQKKIADPAKLYRLIDMVNGPDWVMLDADVKGDTYEDLLEPNAADTKSGAGQYFTPRALIRATVACVRPEPGKTIADPRPIRLSERRSQ